MELLEAKNKYKISLVLVLEQNMYFYNQILYKSYPNWTALSSSMQLVDNLQLRLSKLFLPTLKWFSMGIYPNRQKFQLIQLICSLKISQ